MPDINLDAVLRWFGFIATILSLLKLSIEFNKFYSQQLTNARIFNQRLEELTQRVSNLEKDITAIKEENRDERKRLWDKVMFTENVILNAANKKLNPNNYE